MQKMAPGTRQLLEKHMQASGVTEGLPLPYANHAQNSSYGKQEPAHDRN